MNSLQLNKILENNSITKNYFKGVFASDNIKVPKGNYPYGFVANTDKQGQRGTHWVGFFILNDTSIEYFDSFAEDPNKEIKTFLNQFKNIKTNLIKLQSSFDNSCGSFVIYFIVQRTRGKSFENIIKSLANNSYSDSMVKLFAYSLANKTI